MKDFLQYLGKGLWVPANQADIRPDVKTIRVPASKKRANNRPTPQDDIFPEMEQAIERNGYRSIKLAMLLKRFGFQRKSAQRIDAINTTLRERGLYALPAITADMDTDANLKIYNYPVQQLGDVFDTEKDLEDFVFRSEAYTQLGIDAVTRQYSPNGTKDKMDFKGTNAANLNIVLELKNKGGGKSAVEQVLRYAGQLQKESPELTVRTILVTGIRNYETSLAISGMKPEQRESFEWYLYNYDKQAGTISFVRVQDGHLLQS